MIRKVPNFLLKTLHQNQILTAPYLTLTDLRLIQLSCLNPKRNSRKVISIQLPQQLPLPRIQLNQLLSVLYLSQQLLTVDLAFAHHQ